MDESEPPSETDKQVPAPQKLMSSIEADKEHRRAYEAGELDGEENIDQYHESLALVTQAREREEREELLKEVIEERAREHLPPMTDTEQELAIQLLDKRVKKQKESVRERNERAFGKPSTSADDRSSTATLQTSGFKAPLPPTTIESPFHLAQGKTGIGMGKKLEGRQLLPGGLWKPVGFFHNLSPSDNYQKNPTPKRIGNKPLVELDAAKRIERVWGKVPDHRDWDLRTAVRDALASIRTKRNDYVLPFIDTFRRERRATTIESMAPGPEKMRMVGPLEKIAQLEEG
ncbi:MAG: hypothetical protein GY820_35160, partial [Gammaproteobacteria bacterium]|nr:hypothetical protein [Gammaproteobacteria bacterium]